jgi:hypothetical protein
MLCYFGDNPRPAGAGVRNVDGSVGVLDYGGGDGGEGAFEGEDEIGAAGDVTECVCCVGDAEVWYDMLVCYLMIWRRKGNTVHLVVHYYACFRHHELAAENRVDCAGDGDCEATGIGGYTSGCAAISENSVAAWIVS